MNVRIGITHSPRELDIDMGDGADADKVAKDIETALTDEAPGVIWLTDRKGRRFGIAAAKVAYVEVGPQADAGPVGFKA